MNPIATELAHFQVQQKRRRPALQQLLRWPRFEVLATYHVCPAEMNVIGRGIILFKPNTDFSFVTRYLYLRLW